MAKSEKQKLKLLYIIQCLMEKTDEEHAVTTQEIIDYLALQGITAERKSIYTDIDLLIDFGMDIIKKPGRSGGYTLASRQFELAELKLLVDAVQSSKFITTKKSRELIGKLETLCSKYEATQLHRQVVVTNRNKAINENIYYNVDIIYNAIAENVKIQFQYFEWNVSKEMKLRRDGKIYEVSPWLLTWDDENYYLVSNGIQEIRENGFGRENVPAMMAAVVVISLPLIILFLLFRNKIMSGVSRGGTKG